MDMHYQEDSALFFLFNLKRLKGKIPQPNTTQKEKRAMNSCLWWKHNRRN